MSLPIRNLVFTALFAALFIVFSHIKVPLPFTAVPITLQNLALMLAGAFLGARYGFFSIFIVVALTALGLNLIGGASGLARILGPTGGYIVMFPICAAAVGYFVGKLVRTQLRSDNPLLFHTLLFSIFMVFGSLICYVTGVPWLAYSYNLTFEKAMAGGFYPFLLGDAIKAVLATVIASALYAYVPVLKPARKGGFESSTFEQSA